LLPPEEYAQDVDQAYQKEALLPTQGIRAMNPSLFFLAADNWRQILSFSPTIQADALLVEVKGLIKNGTFAHDTPSVNEAVIPVKSKYRVKLAPCRLVEKLKARTALRGDLMKDNLNIPDTWCPIAEFRSLKIFLSMAARMK
jgi:hypothetical protein